MRPLNVFICTACLSGPAGCMYKHACISGMKASQQDCYSCTQSAAVVTIFGGYAAIYFNAAERLAKDAATGLSAGQWNGAIALQASLEGYKRRSRNACTVACHLLHAEEDKLAGILEVLANLCYCEVGAYMSASMYFCHALAIFFFHVLRTCAEGCIGACQLLGMHGHCKRTSRLSKLFCSQKNYFILSSPCLRSLCTTLFKPRSSP